ncbi:MAG TPA: cardiolipin synthase [Propionibacteriaceae bacterium]|nr:cardiolipin synthase [Propionibacteriaceae bacterium]
MLLAQAVNVWMVVDVLLVLYWIAVVLFVVSEDRDPTAALAWLLVLIALPVVGLVIYFFFGRNWPIITQRSAKTKRVFAAAAAFMPGVYAPYREKVVGHPTLEKPWIQRNITLIESTVFAPVLPVRTCDIYGEGDEYFDVLLADLAAATRFIHMSYFIWGKDELTARISAILHDRLKAGVEVRILNDSVGCLAYRKDELKALAAAGAHVRSDLTGLARVNYSNHRKITVVDAEIGHSGGFNIGQEYIDGGKRFPAWRDTGIRITGAGVADLEKLFDVRWFDAHGENLFDASYYPDPALPAGDIMVQTVHQGYDDPWTAVTRSYQLAISSAKDRVQVQTPYFVPDPTTLDALINAAASGVQVDLMTTHWLDKKVPWWAAESFFEQFLQAGGRIWKWEKGFFHAKSITIDGEACSIGTLNLDIRSLKINKELMIWVYDPKVAAEHERLFLDDLKECKQVTLAEVQGWSRPRKLRNSVFRLFSNLL